MTARFSIGIDLGTTSSALAYVPLAGDAHANVLAVAQWETTDTLIEATTLPSFLYLPEDAVAAQLRGQAAGQARYQGASFVRQSRGFAITRPIGQQRSFPGDPRIYRPDKKSLLFRLPLSS